MAYQTMEWKDGTEGGTPLNAENLNNMIEGIDEVSVEVKAARGNYDSLNARLVINEENINNKLDDSSGSVKATNIATGSVTTGKLANNAVTNIKIADGAVTEGKLNNLDFLTYAQDYFRDKTLFAYYDGTYEVDVNTPSKSDLLRAYIPQDVSQINVDIYEPYWRIAPSGAKTRSIYINNIPSNVTIVHNDGSSAEHGLSYIYFSQFSQKELSVLESKLLAIEVIEPPETIEELKEYFNVETEYRFRSSGEIAELVGNNKSCSLGNYFVYKPSTYGFGYSWSYQTITCLDDGRIFTRYKIGSSKWSDFQECALPDLTDYVKTTNYAKANKGGVIKSGGYGLVVNSDGTVFCNSGAYSTDGALLYHFVSFDTIKQLLSTTMDSGNISDIKVPTTQALVDYVSDKLEQKVSTINNVAPDENGNVDIPQYTAGNGISINNNVISLDLPIYSGGVVEND